MKITFRSVKSKIKLFLMVKDVFQSGFEDDKNILLVSYVM